MDLKCGSVTGSTFMARFDLNHPFMLHFGERRAMRLRCAWMCSDLLCFSYRQLSRVDRWRLNFDPAHHGNGWKKPSPPRRLFSLSHFRCFCGSLLLWKWRFLLAKCQTDLVFYVQQESLAVYYRLRAWRCSHDVHWVSLFFPFLKVVLEQFLLFCWGRKKDKRKVLLD